MSDPNDYVIGIFVLPEQAYAELHPAFLKAYEALEGPEESWIEPGNATYAHAAEKAIELVELGDPKTVSCLETFADYLDDHLPEGFPDVGIYTPKEAATYLKTLERLEAEHGGATGLGEQIWQLDRDLDREGVQNLYDEIRRVLTRAVEMKAAFAVDVLI